MLQVDGLRKAFGKRVAVDDVSFAVAPGETYGLLGPNGAGKTTTISLICGLLVPDAGTAAIAGADILSEPLTAKAAIGLVPQDIALYPDLSARENLRLFGRLQGLNGHDLSNRIDETLDLVGLADRAEERIEAYSGGMKRRANIATGLLHRPKLLVLDEPTVGVDPQSRNAILESIEALGGAGLSMLYTTHCMEEAERLCHRVGIIDEGRLIAEGSRQELLAATGGHAALHLDASGPIAQWLADVERIDGVVGVAARSDGAEVQMTSAQAVLAPVIDAAARNSVAVGSVEIVEPDLESVFLHLTGKALRD